MSDWAEVVRCKYCNKRYTIDCPMFHLEFLTYDKEQWCPSDFTYDDGFCDRGEYREWQTQ